MCITLFFDTEHFKKCLILVFPFQEKNVYYTSCELNLKERILLIKIISEAGQGHGDGHVHRHVHAEASVELFIFYRIFAEACEEDSADSTAKSDHRTTPLPPKD